MQFKKSFTLLAVVVVILTIVVLFGNFFQTHAVSKTPDSTVGYVDMERIQKEHPDFINLAEVMKDKETELNLLKSYLNKQLDSFGRDIKSKMDQEKNGKSTDEQAKIEQKYQEQYQAKGSDLNNQLIAKSNEVNEYVNQQKTTAMDKFKKTVEEVATERKLTLVLDQSARLYGGVDITQAVLDKVKASAKTETKNPKTGK